MTSFTILAGEQGGRQTLSGAETGTLEAGSFIGVNSALELIRVSNPTGAVINNAGTISQGGEGDAIFATGDSSGSLTIINTGTIQSNGLAVFISDDIDVVLDNAGVIRSALDDFYSVILAGGDDRLVIRNGSEISNWIEGSGGTDTLDYRFWAGSGVTADLGTYRGTGFTNILGFENIVGSAQGDLLSGSGDRNLIDGGGGNDTLDGIGGDDTLRGGAGDDILVGGTGNDLADYSAESVDITVSLDVTTGQVTGAGTDRLSGFENVIGGSANDSLTGDGAANQLAGGAGNDSLTGGNGADTLIGGTGNDTLSGGGDVDTADYRTGTANLSANLATGVATDGLGGMDSLTGVDNLVGGAGNDTLTGDGNGNVLDGSIGNDVLVGGVGSDTLIGGVGNDVADYSANGAAPAIVANLAAGTVVDGLGGGTDRLLTIENVTGGAGNDRMTGDGNGNVLTGGAGNDTLIGGAGNDTLSGGGDVDTADYSTGSANLSANLATGVATDGLGGTDSLVGVDNLVGGAGNDTLTGDGNGNVLNGGGGNDTLVGGVGSDTLVGGADNDVADYSANSATQAIVANLVAGTVVDGLGGGTDSLQTIENVTGGAGNDRMTGDGNANVLTGGAGNDTLNGGAGNDTLTGGEGTDVLNYAGETAAVVVNLATNSAIGTGIGADSVSGFEVVQAGGGDDQVGGTGAAETISAGAGADTVDGGGAADSILGGAGHDSLVGGDGNDTILGGDGDDVVLGGSGDDSIVSTPGLDTVEAGKGNDVVDVGEDDDLVIWRLGDGNDTISLGAGNDTLDLSGWTGGTGDLWETILGGSGETLFIYDQAGAGAATISASGFESVTCFATGTLIMTARGEVPVEDLRIGDLAVTTNDIQGPLRPIVWIGHSRINIAAHRDPSKVAPILIKAGALAQGIPHRDLRVSPEHALFLDGGLVPARLLVNGSTIVQELWCARETYWHIELPAHGLLVSQGAISESYFDDGNRAQFDNHGVTAFFRDFESNRDTGQYAAAVRFPLILDGALLDRIRLRLAVRAGAALLMRERGAGDAATARARMQPAA
jgi:Ca2+-binding RTX toxin-like protein